MAQPGGGQGVVSESQHSQGRPGRLQHQRERLPIGGAYSISSGRRRGSVLRNPCRIRPDRCGHSVMDATLIVIDSAAELARARTLVERLWNSDVPTDIARLQAQARLIEAYEEN